MSEVNNQKGTHADHDPESSSYLFHASRKGYADLDGLVEISGYYGYTNRTKKQPEMEVPAESENHIDFTIPKGLGRTALRLSTEDYNVNIEIIPKNKSKS